MDDSQAALHELGRENQSLQVGTVDFKLNATVSQDLIYPVISTSWSH